jgi:hypothetical protein
VYSIQISEGVENDLERSTHQSSETSKDCRAPLKYLLASVVPEHRVETERKKAVMTDCPHWRDSALNFIFHMLFDNAVSYLTARI